MKSTIQTSAFLLMFSSFFYIVGLKAGKQDAEIQRASEASADTSGTPDVQPDTVGSGLEFRVNPNPPVLWFRTYPDPLRNDSTDVSWRSTKPYVFYLSFPCMTLKEASDTEAMLMTFFRDASVSYEVGGRGIRNCGGSGL